MHVIECSTFQSPAMTQDSSRKSAAGVFVRDLLQILSGNRSDAGLIPKKRLQSILQQVMSSISAVLCYCESHSDSAFAVQGFALSTLAYCAGTG